MKDERLYLGHIREAIADIRSYAAVGERVFREDPDPTAADIQHQEDVDEPECRRDGHEEVAGQCLAGVVLHKRAPRLRG